MYRRDHGYGTTIGQTMTLLFMGWFFGSYMRPSSLDEHDVLINENDALREENQQLRQLVGRLALGNTGLQFGVVIENDPMIDRPFQLVDASEEALQEPILRPWCCLPSYTMLYAPMSTRCDCYAWLRRPLFMQQNRCYGHALDAGAHSD